MRISLRQVCNLALATVCCLALSVPLLAQVGTGAIGGSVTDDSGAVLPGATVTISNPGAIGGDQSTVTDAQGVYQFTHLVPGTYSVKGEMQGFTSVVQPGVNVNGDRTSRADLKLAVGNVSETITVSGLSPLLDMTSAAKTTVMTREVLDALPTGGDVWSIARLTPAVHMSQYDVGGRNMFGQSGASAHGSNERETFVDGQDINQYGGTYYVDSYSFEELGMQTANVAAERSTGGVVWNFVTKTGTNRFHGTNSFLGMTHGCCESNNISPEIRAQLLAAVPPYALAANPNPALGTSVEHMFDLPASFTGPIVKDKVWFAVTGHLGEVDTRRVGSYNADGTQLLSDNQLRQESAKVTAALSTNNQVSYYQSWVHKGRYHVAGGPTVTEFFSEEATIRNPARHWFHIAKWTDVVTSKTYLDVGGSLAYGNNDQHPQPEVPDGAIPHYDTVTRIHTVASFNYPINPGWRANINTNLSYTTGTHEFKFGNQFIRSNVTTGAISTADPPLVAQFSNGAPISVRTYNIPATSEGKILTDGIYAQDKWRPIPKMTLSLGVRFDLQRGWMEDGTSPLCQVQTVFIAAQCFPAVKNAPNSKAVVPRMSMVYDLFGNGRTGIKFSANQYTERITTTYPTRISGIAVKSDTRTWVDANKDLIPQLNELGPSTGYNLGSTNRYADGYKLPHVNEIDAEVEQQLSGQVVVSAGYFYRAYRDNLGTRNLLVPTSGYTPITVVEKNSGATVTVYNQDPATRGLFDTVYDNESTLDRTFNGVDFGVQKRMSNHWMLMASFNYGKNVGDFYGTADLNNPNFAFRHGIPTADDVPTLFKLSGAYQLPFKIETAGNYSYYTGWPQQTTVSVGADTVRLTQVTQVVTIEPIGTKRFVNVNQVDLSFKRAFTNGRLKIQPRMDIFNVLNSAAVTNAIQQLGPTYGNVIDLLGSRMIKLGWDMSW